MFFKGSPTIKIVLLALIFLSLITRFYKLDWGEGHFFHPDELNMAISVTKLSSDNFDPQFYAYGQFPTYSTYFSIMFTRLFTKTPITEPISLAQAVISLRFYSAFYSLVSVYLFFLIGKILFSKKIYALIFAFLVVFTPGIIQLAHFGTTESLLILVFAGNILISLKHLGKNNFKLLFLASVISGIAVSTKISALLLTTPVYLSILLSNLSRKKIKNIVFSLLIFTIFIGVFYALSSPYNLINFQDFKSALNYEVAVASGNMKVFYTNQFLDSTPYLFQLTKIFPYAQGLFVFILSFAGLFFLLKKVGRKWLLVLVSSFVFLIYTGQLYVKWSRFMSPIFFLSPLLTTYLFSKIKNKLVVLFLVTLSILPGVYYFSFYFSQDIRLQADEWFVNNIPPSSKILSEAGNVVNFPYSHPYDVNNFDFYNLDNNPLLVESLAREVRISDYIIVPSRRIFKNQNGEKFPVSQKYYDSLFSGSLGFVEIKKFHQNNSLLLNSENAEETWSVFDSPTIRVFKKSDTLTLEEYRNLLNSYDNET